MITEYFYVHIPKTGGRYIILNLNNKSISTQTTAHLPYKEIKKQNMYDFENVNYIPFSSVRNPYKWLESWWNFFCIEEKHFSNFTFEDFIHQAELNATECNWFRNKIPQQSWWLEDVPVQNILKLETLQNDCENFFKVKFLDKEATNKLWSGTGSSMDEVYNTYKKPEWTREMLDIVNNKFHDDFICFQYFKR